MAVSPPIPGPIRKSRSRLPSSPCSYQTGRPLPRLPFFLQPIRSPSPAVSRVRAARGRTSPPPSSCGTATILTTTQSLSARTRSPSAASSARRFAAVSTPTRCTPDRDGRCSVQGKSWASRFAAGLFAPIAAARRFPLLSLSPPRAAPAPRCAWPPPSAVAALRAGARPLGLRQRAVRYGPGTVSSLRCGPHHFPALRSGALAVSAPVLGREAAGAAWGVCKAPTDVLVQCATRALCANPAGGGVLRCAAARGGSARHRAGATVAQPQPPLRPAQARAKLR